jgi:hypothetical protein
VEPRALEWIIRACYVALALTAIAAVFGEDILRLIGR